MNLKLAKNIRRIANDIVRSREDLSYETQYFLTRGGVSRLDPRCLRGVYRRIRHDPAVHALAREMQRQMRLAKKERR